MKYKIKFTGREANAIGSFGQHEMTVEANSVSAARLKVYEKFEHLTEVDMRDENNNKMNFFGIGGD